MDNRWPVPKNDAARNASVFLQPTASIEQVQNGPTTDAIDVTPWVTDGSQSAESMTVVLRFAAGQFTGANQPRPGQIINTMEDGLVLAIMVIDTISSYNVSFGERTMTITARTRETQDIWKTSKYNTASYPQGTNITTIISNLAQQIGLLTQDISLPVSSVSTSHTNTQLGNTTGWEAMQTLFLPLGLLPFIDTLGRLRGASKDLIGRTPDIILKDYMVKSVGGSRQRPPTSRYILNWLDPNLTKVTQQAKVLATATMTAGFFTPILWKHLGFSADGTQRAENTYLRPRTSVNQFRIGGTVFLPCFLEYWMQDTDVNGKIMIITLGWTYAALAAALAVKYAAHNTPDGVAVAGIGASGGYTIPVGRRLELAADVTIMTLLAAMGTGDYEIWGVPFDYSHARNTSEAYDSSALPWLDNPVTVECDLIMNESHAQAVCTRELVYQARAANSYSATIVEDRRIEKGTILQFSDGSQLFVTNFTRSLRPGHDNTLDVEGFLVNG